MRENGPGSRSPLPAAGGDPGIHSPVQDVQWERAGTENLVVEGLDVHLRGQFLLCPAAQFEYFELD
jgi:hypothetical protein